MVFANGKILNAPHVFHRRRVQLSCSKVADLSFGVKLQTEYYVIGCHMDKVAQCTFTTSTMFLSFLISWRLLRQQICRAVLFSAQRNAVISRVSNTCNWRACNIPGTPNKMSTGYDNYIPIALIYNSSSGSIYRNKLHRCLLTWQTNKIKADNSSHAWIKSRTSLFSLGNTPFVYLWPFQMLAPGLPNKALFQMSFTILSNWGKNVYVERLFCYHISIKQFHNLFSTFCFVNFVFYL